MNGPVSRFYEGSLFSGMQGVVCDPRQARISLYGKVLKIRAAYFFFQTTSMLVRSGPLRNKRGRVLTTSDITDNTSAYALFVSTHSDCHNTVNISLKGKYMLHSCVKKA